MLKKADTPQKPPRKPARPYKRGTGTRITFMALGFVVALIIGFRIVNYERAQRVNQLAEAAKHDASAPPPVDVVTVQSAPATQELELPGEAAAWYESKIYARVNGYVGKWFVDIGDHVANGQVLATIETPELDAELLASKAKLAVAQSQVTVKQADDDFAKSTYERWRTSPQGVVSKQETEAKKAAAISADAQLTAAKAQVTLNKADVDRLTALTHFKEVRAPYDGTIVKRDIDIGNLVTAGSTSSTSYLYKIAKDDPIRVFVYAPQSAAFDLLKGDVKAVIKTRDGSGRRYQATVTRTSKSINPQARTLRVELDIPNPDAMLVPGMYVQTVFEIKNSSGVQIQAAALVFRPGPKVAVVDDKGVVDFRDVKIGVDDGNIVQIASGLKVGDKVALNISSQIGQGQKVDARDVTLRSSGKVAHK